MFFPTQDALLDMTPIDFEKYSLQILSEQVRDVEIYKIEHNKIMEVSDGNYQIDGYIEFEFMGLKYKTLVECKHYKNSISREKVQVLLDKIRATGAHKGVLISTSSFQSGAITYATEHGIALIQIAEAGIQYATRSFEMNLTNSSQNVPRNNGAPYIGVMQYSCDTSIHYSYLSDSNKSLKEFLLQIGNDL